MISIIVHVCNSEKSLNICLNSILNQTYQNFEVICINDASSDSSKEILEYFTLKDSRIKFINNETKKGELYSINQGLNNARGNYVTFLNSDEWIYSSTLDTLVKHSKNNNVDLIFYNNSNLDIEDYEIINPNDLEISKIEILNNEWGRFYLKSIHDENYIKLFKSAKRISIISNTFKNSQNTNIDSDSLDGKINEKYLMQVKNQLSNINFSIKEQQNQINEFVDSQNKLDKSLIESAKVFMDFYSESKKYFFNNQEKMLKKYFDTNELFKLCYLNNFKFISYSPAENRILIKTDDGILVGSNNRFYTIKEVIGFNGYSIPQLYDFDEFTVFDVGMNRAYASLWFAKFNNCKSVYGFEIDPETYNKAVSNINLNPHLLSKIKTYNFGLSNQDKVVDMFYVDGCDGVNTMFDEIVNRQSELRDSDKLNTKKVQVKKASETLNDIIKNEKIASKIVLKIDTEGSEYDIIEDLIGSGVINKIDVLLGEGHVFDREHFCDKLEELGFKRIDLQINPVTYNFAFVKKDYFTIWPLKEQI